MEDISALVVEVYGHSIFTSAMVSEINCFHLFRNLKYNQFYQNIKLIRFHISIQMCDRDRACWKTNCRQKVYDGNHHTYTEVWHSVKIRTSNSS